MISDAEVPVQTHPYEARVLCSGGLAPMPRNLLPSELGSDGSWNVVNDGDLPGHSHKAHTLQLLPQLNWYFF